MKKVFKNITVALMLTTTISCSTARFRYESDIELNDGRATKYSLEKSYNVSSDSTLCLITGIVYGGWCWFYLGMPRESQRLHIRDDAARHLNDLLGKNNYKIKSEYYSKVSWEEGHEKSELFNSSNQLAAATNKSVLVGPVIKPKPTKDLDKPLSIIKHQINLIPETDNMNDLNSYHDRVELILILQNNGSRIITAWEVTAQLQTKLGTDLGKFKLTSNSSSIDAGDTEEASFIWKDNPLISNEIYDKVASVSSENLIVKIISQKVVKK